MDEISFCCSRLCFSIHLVLCVHLISSSPTSVNGDQTKTDSGCLPCIFLEHSLSSGSTSPGNISFQAFYYAETSSQCFVFYECVWASLFANESLPFATNKKTEDCLGLTNNSSLLIYYNCCRCCGLHNLPTI